MDELMTPTQQLQDSEVSELANRQPDGYSQVSSLRLMPDTQAYPETTEAPPGGGIYDDLAFDHLRTSKDQPNPYGTDVTKALTAVIDDFRAKRCSA